MTTLRRVLAQSAAAAAAPPRVTAAGNAVAPAAVASPSVADVAASAPLAPPVAVRRRTDSVERSRQRAKVKKPKAAAAHGESPAKRAVPAARPKPSRAKPRMDDSVSAVQACEHGRATRSGGGRRRARAPRGVGRALVAPRHRPTSPLNVLTCPVSRVCLLLLPCA